MGQFAVAALYACAVRERRPAVPYRAGFDRRYKDQTGPLPGNPAGTHSMNQKHGQPLSGHREAAPLPRSEFKSRAHLDIARPADAAVPQPELIAAGCAGHVVVEGLSSPLAGTGEGVPVEQVEELRP